MSTAFAPFYAVSGAPGSGKSTISPELIRTAAGIVVIRGRFDTNLMTDGLEPPIIAKKALAWARSTPVGAPASPNSETQ